MSYESSRRALRDAMLPILGGFLLMIAAVGLWAAASSVDALTPAARFFPFAGALGSGVLLMGALRLARASVDGRPSYWLLAFFGLWLAEFTLRLWTMAGAEDPVRLRATRILIGAAAMICFSSGARQIWKDGATWATTRWLFLLQLVAVAGLTLTGVPQLADSPVGQSFEAAAWLAFAAPYAHVVLSIRRTVRWLSGSETVAEILTS